ncbi:MAG: hypothetical protein GX638_17400 [Crenarchaeota archaeon]|nr:hypothetical protein [Thermoproteota archaeon]
MEKKYPYIVGFDVETEGLNCKYHKIIELGSIKVDFNGRVVDTFSKFANPGRKLDKKITEITGITDDMLIGAQDPDTVINEWMEWVDSDSVLVAHNAPFDIGFVTYPFIRQGLEFNDYFVVDTLDWSRSCYSNLKKHTLGSLLEHINFNEGNLHRALDDAKGAVKLAAVMMKKCHNPSKPEEIYSNFRLYGKNLKQYLSRKKYS